MSGKNLTNDEVNKMFLKRTSYKRVGECSDCHGRCCNFAGIEGHHTDYEYWKYRGEVVEDQWQPDRKYIVLSSKCQACSLAGFCNVWENMPEACRQFPITPNDLIWRYLKQKGVPCGFRFIDKETGLDVDLSEKYR